MISARYAIGAALAGTLAMAGPGRAQELVEPSTGTGFVVNPEVGGQQFECLGAGLRKVFVVKAYAVAFCLEQDRVDDVVGGYLQQAPPQERSSPDALKKDAAFWRNLSRAPGDRLIVMKMTRDVSREQLADAFRDSLEHVLPAEKIDRLVAAIPAAPRKGQVVHLRSEGGRLEITIGDQAQTIDDPEIAAKLWDVWLSPQSVSPSLRESIAKRVTERAP